MYATATEFASALVARGYELHFDRQFEASVVEMDYDPEGRGVHVRVYFFGKDGIGQDVGIRWVAGNTWYNRDSDLAVDELLEEVIGSIVLEPTQYLSLNQVAAKISVSPNSLSRYSLPSPDVVVGPLNPDGTIPRGTVRGWKPETIERWHASRPGRGTRSDLRQPAPARIHKAKFVRGGRTK
jgi:hypothetical protein